MEQDGIGAAARQIRQAWRDQAQFDDLPAGQRPRDMAEGYAIQDALAALDGLEAYGWKIAATNVEGQRHIGVDAPVAGRLFAQYRLADGAEASAGGLHMAVAEPELAVRLGRDLPPRDRPYTQAEVTEAVGAVHLGIEIPDSRFRDFAKAGGACLAADNACAHQYVVGPEAAGWRDVDLAKAEVVCLLNGAEASRGTGERVLGHPLAALAWLANELSRRGDGLKAGEIVTTGTMAKPVGIAPGDTVTCDFGTMGTVSVRFVA